MKINSVTLKNIKIFKEETHIEFYDNLNIFVGPNAGGKSNLLEIIQGVFNNLIFENVDITKNNDQKIKTPYKIQRRNKNNQFIQDFVLDKYYGNENREQKVTLSLKIETQDIQNIKNLYKYKENIISFENEQMGSNLIENLLNQMDSLSDFDILDGSLINIGIVEGTIVEPQNTLTRLFFDFFKNSNVIANFVNFYNLLNEEKIDFYPYLIYISPYRAPINVNPTEPWVILSGDERADATFFKQENFNQETNFSLWDRFKRKVVENQFLNKKNQNDFLLRLLEDDLHLTFNITLKRRLDNAFEIKFYRKDNTSPKLSSGEKEFLNLISAIFVHQIKNGVILIDEPELHLHPTWQRKLMNLFNKLSEEQGIQFFIVTHSPQFITTDYLKNTFRVYIEDGVSKVFTPKSEELENLNTKDVFQIVNVLNNEKIFFADKVILVEGVVDRIIYGAVLRILQEKEENNDKVVEIMEVYGKESFGKFKRFLETWKIKTYIIADFNYLATIANDDIKNLFRVDYDKIKNSLNDKRSKDAGALLESLNKVINKKKEELTNEDLKNLKQLFTYIASRNISLKSNLTDEERDKINNYIKNQYSNKIFILKKGDIEDYFEGGHFDIEKAINMSKKMEKDHKFIPKEFKFIFNRIFED